MAAWQTKETSSRAGFFVYGNYLDLDQLYHQQAVELDHQKREAIRHKTQQIVYERTIYAPIWQLAFINGVGPRVGESGFGLIPRFPYTAPWMPAFAGMTE